MLLEAACRLYFPLPAVAYPVVSLLFLVVLLLQIFLEGLRKRLVELVLNIYDIIHAQSNYLYEHVYTST